MVSSPTGERLVERQYLMPTPRGARHRRRAVEVLFNVRWDASDPERPTRCTIDEPPRGDLHVRVFDVDGQPQDDVVVWGCGAHARAQLAPDEVRDVRMELGQTALPEDWSADTLNNGMEDYEAYQPEVDERTERLAALEAQLAQAPADSREAEVLQQVVRHQAWLLERDRARVAIDEDGPPPKDPTDEQLREWLDRGSELIEDFVRRYWSGHVFELEGSGTEAPQK